MVAEARYVRSADSSVAEFAVSVADQWQGQGLASRLLSTLLCRASTAGVQRMVGETLATNDKMLHLARKAGFTITHSPDARGVMLLEKTVEPAAAGTPCNDAAAESAAGLTQPSPAVAPALQAAGEHDHGQRHEPQRRRQQHEKDQHRGKRPHGNARKYDRRTGKPIAQQRHGRGRPNR